MVGEVVCDLANAILQDKAWDSKKLRHKFQDRILEPEYLKGPYQMVRRIRVLLSINANGDADNYIDDVIVVLPATSAPAVRRGLSVTLLTFGTLERPLAQEKPVTRDAVVSLKKLDAKGMPSETQTVLGWMVNTSLPDDKYHHWKIELVQLITSQQSRRKEMEIVTGRLNHATYAIPTRWHFLGNLWHFITKFKTNKLWQIAHPVKLDMQLWLDSLDQANCKGIDLNLLTLQAPDKRYLFDSSPAGFGGFCTDGWAWQWQIPFSLQYQATINQLGF